MAFNIANLGVMFQNGQFRMWVYKLDGNGESDTVDGILDANGDVGTFFDGNTEALDRIEDGDVIMFVHGAAAALVTVTANSGTSITTAVFTTDTSPPALS